MTKSAKIIIFSLLFLVILLLTTQPRSLPSFLLILPFLLLFSILSFTLAGLFQKVGVSRRKSVRLGVLGSLLPVMLLILQSIGQLTLRDLLTMAALFCIGYFYFSRISDRLPS
ncbi:MAG TPA: hypothetical protein VJ836_00035 [Candidatus Saccharimonadales bacterium]|nr:hypothetical protein [Candidatus Saccharimonadales bacterium]